MEGDATNRYYVFARDGSSNRDRKKIVKANVPSAAEHNPKGTP